MAIYIHSEAVDIPKFSISRIKNWIKKVIEEEGFIVGEINIIFVNNDYILNINNQFLSHNYYTDIITFDYCENKIISGDLFLSIEMIAENALNLNVNFYNEINRVIIHGILHLLGYSDKDEAEIKIMRKKEDSCLNIF